MPATQVPIVGLELPDVVVLVGVADVDVDWLAEPGDLVLLGFVEDAAAVPAVVDGVELLTAPV